MGWDGTENLMCDRCPVRYGDRGSRPKTRTAARVRGWHINEEEEYKDGSILCPACAQSPRPRLRRHEPLAGDQPMFELEEKDVRSSTPDHN